MSLANWQLFELATKQPDIHRILLYGAPGTGKSTAACRLGKHYSVTLHEESCASELLGHWIKKGEGYEYHYGSGVLPFRDGNILVLNEIDKVSSSVMTILHALLDDKEIAHITLPTNETIHAHQSFKVVATMNGEPDELSEPLLDRFDAILKVTAPHPSAVARLSPFLQQICNNSYSTSNPAVSFRKLLTYDKLVKKGMDSSKAADLVFHNIASDVIAAIKLGVREGK